MRAIGVMVLVLFAVAPAPAARAASFDGSSPLLCAVTDIMECEPRGDCRRRAAADVDLPSFLTIDTKAGRVATLGPVQRSAPIQRMEVVNGGLILQGGQEGRGWSAAITGETGRLSVGVVHEDVAFAVFGSCIPHRP